MSCIDCCDVCVHLILLWGWVCVFGNDDSDDKFVSSVCLSGIEFSYGEFDPGSGRTLAACLTHASRAERLLRGYSSGERVSNT